MRDQLGVDFFANSVSMLRASVDGAIWLVDDEDEASFYEKCAHDKALVLLTHGLALQLLEVVEQRGIEGVIACPRGCQGPDGERGNVFRPSTGDIASLLLVSRSFDLVIEDICGTAWLTASEKQVGSIRHRVVWIARVLQQLRQECRAEKPSPLDRDVCELIRWDVFEVNWEGIRATLADNALTPIALEEVSAGEKDPRDIRVDLLDCDGKDALQLLAAATRMFRPRGIAARKVVGAAEIMGMLRVAFHLDELETDEMFWRMRRWERRNSTYPLLRKWKTLDPLGVVWDQRYWETDLNSILRSVGPNGQLAALKMDLDNFKSVNDTLGHGVGDEAIRLYCSIIRKVMGKHGEIYRRGGDEVVVLVPELDPTIVRALAEETRAAIESEFREWGIVRGIETSPTASVGLVLTNGDCSSEQVIRLMDQAQQRAKQEGKNRVVCLQ